VGVIFNTSHMAEQRSIVAKIRSAYEHDWLRESEDELLDILDARIVYVPEPGSGPPVAGIHEVRRLLVTGRGECESCRYLLESVEPINDRGALVFGRVVAELRRSRSRVSFPFTHVWHAHGARFDRIEAFLERDDAASAIDAGRRGQPQASSAL
jgi:hypothetical protein